MPWFTVELLDADGAPVPQGERGEIVVRSLATRGALPGLSTTIPRRPRRLCGTARCTPAISAPSMPTATCIFHGRMTDSVRCKGENVSAWEVEHVAADHPAVEDCAMIGVAADIGEQDIKLFVKPQPAARSIRRRCRAGSSSASPPTRTRATSPSSTSSSARRASAS